MQVRSRAGDTVNGILYRETGRYDDDAEEALWRINPGLSEYGPVLPAGVMVALPMLETRSEAAENIMSVWD